MILELLLAVAVALGAELHPPPENVPALELDWQAPASCPTAEDLRQRVANYLGRDAQLRQLHARVRATRDGRSWTLTLEFGAQKRELRASSCDSVAEAAAVVLSLALAPGGSVKHDAPATAKATPPSPSVGDPRRSDDAGQVEPVRAANPKSLPPGWNDPLPTGRGSHRRVDLGPELRIAAGIGVGVTPTLTTARLTLGWAWRSARMEVTGTLWTPADTQELAGGRPVRVTLGTVGARGCAVLSGGPLRFPACVGGSIGALRVDSTHALWAGATLSATMVWPFGRVFSLWLGPEAVIAFRRVEVPITPRGDLYRSGRAAVKGMLGLGVHFPSRVRARAGNMNR